MLSINAQSSSETWYSNFSCLKYSNIEMYYTAWVPSNGLVHLYILYICNSICCHIHYVMLGMREISQTCRDLKGQMGSVSLFFCLLLTPRSKPVTEYKLCKSTQFNWSIHLQLQCNFLLHSEANIVLSLFFHSIMWKLKLLVNSLMITLH